jgi:hypothetical protein
MINVCTKKITTNENYLTFNFPHEFRKFQHYSDQTLGRSPCRTELKLMDRAMISPPLHLSFGILFSNSRPRLNVVIFLFNSEDDSRNKEESAMGIDLVELIYQCCNLIWSASFPRSLSYFPKKYITEVFLINNKKL